METRANLLRSLGDKLYEKRKAAALEIEELIRGLIKVNNTRLVLFSFIRNLLN